MSSLLLPDIHSPGELVLPTGISRAHALTMNTAEKFSAVVGLAALSEIANFGSELAKGNASARALESGDLLSLDNAKILAKFMPDTVIALHSYQATMGSALSSANSLLGNLTAENFREFAIAFSSLNSSDHDLIQHSSGGLRPIWTILSESKIASLVQAQYGSYLKRLSLQPNGGKILAEMQASKDNQFADDMSRVMTVLVYDGLRLLGQDTLKYLRYEGQRQAGSLISPIDAGSFEQVPLSHLNTEGGGIIQIEGHVAWKLGEIVHQSWLQARRLVATNEASKTASASGLVDYLTSFSDLNIKTQNYDILGGFCLTSELVAKLSQADFDRLLEVSPETSASDLVRTLNISSDQCLTGDLEVTSSVPKKEDGALRFTFVAEVQSLHTLLERVERVLRAEENGLLEQACIYSDLLTCLPYEPGFVELCANLRNSCILRKELFGLAEQLVQGLPREQLAKMPSLADENLLKFIATSLQGPWSKVLSERYDQYLELVHSVKSGMNLNLDCNFSTKIASYDDLQRLFPQFRQMISAAIKPAQSGSYKTSGGIVTDYYSMEFMTSFIEAGNHLLLHLSKDAELGQKLNGFFMYYIPGHIPANHGQVPDYMLKNDNLSFAELIMTTPDRPSGTYARLFRGLVLRLQKYGVDYSCGLRAACNLKQAQALAHLGHFSQNISTIADYKNQGIVVEWVPEVLPVHPDLLKLFGQKLKS